MKTKIYSYSKCSTCQKALKFIKAKNLPHEVLPIVEDPPTKKVLQMVLHSLKRKGGTFKNLFNTSGVQYREMKISDKMKAGMTEAEALDMLSKNGKLIKRPLVIRDDEGLVGFKEDEWKAFFKK